MVGAPRRPQEVSAARMSSAHAQWILPRQRGPVGRPASLTVCFVRSRFTATMIYVSPPHFGTAVQHEASAALQVWCPLRVAVRRADTMVVGTNARLPLRHVTVDLHSRRGSTESEE